MIITFTPQEYQAWIQTKHKEQEMGNVHATSDCPVYRFLQETQTDKVFMLAYSFCVLNTGEITSVATWIQDFQYELEAYAHREHKETLVAHEVETVLQKFL